MRTDIKAEVVAICAKFEVDPKYVKRISFDHSWIDIDIIRGADGFCQGKAFIVCENNRRASKDPEDGQWVCLCPSGGATHSQDTYDVAMDRLRYRISTA